MNLSRPKGPKVNCVISFDRRFVKDAAVVVFSAEHFNIHDIPIERSQDQVYIWHNLQAPGVYNLNRKRSLKSLTEENGAASNKFFNWTATYSSTSDIIVSPKVLPRKSDSSLLSAVFTLSPAKKKLAAWYPPECETDSGREAVQLRLQDLPVDVFGSCGTHVCPEDQCWEYLSLCYIFYLSFEDNLCVDYISDQVWGPLKAGLVPVVYGGANYSTALPPNSYIDARQFTAANLTSFLKRLSSNLSELETYHRWRTSYVIEDPNFPYELCSKSHAIQRSSFWGPTVDHVQSNTTLSLLQWWLDANKCWTDYPKKTNANKVLGGIGSVINLLKKMKIL
ncbi:Glycosyl transferase family 10 [Trinorchestia longiramus]|nr:Glycosyl transferase family 10 [Trinorchestia longiramus]